jgi:hypothetical protein
MRTHSHKKYYVTNIIGGLTSQDIRFELLNEILESEEGRHYVADAMIILSPIGAKRLQKELNESIKKYESENGTIPLEPTKEHNIKVSTKEKHIEDKS